jgi:predicted DNA-binding transcriptional regulator AlpA
MNDDVLRGFRIMSQKEVAAMLGVSVGTFIKMKEHPAFPRRKDFGGATRGWLLKDICDWAESRPVG